ncbi:hypothetical protein WJX82_005273 [Trebouxia sp. C0006]
MASSRVQRSVLCFVLLLNAATSSSAQVPSASDYLAPIPAPANSPCEDTAPDCMDVCGCDDTGIELACRLSSPIGEYLRANCKKTCGICGPLAPAPSQPYQLPTSYGTSSGSYACTDVTPPQSPFTCAQQKAFGKCTAAFITDAAPGAPLGYCQITCGSAPWQPIQLCSAERLWKVQRFFHDHANPWSASRLLPDHLQPVQNDCTLPDGVGDYLSGITPTPTSGITPTSTCGATPTPTSGITPTSTCGVTPTPTSGITPTPTSGLTPTPTSGITPTPTSGINPTPTSGITPTPCGILTSVFATPTG